MKEAFAEKHRKQVLYLIGSFQGSFDECFDHINTTIEEKLKQKLWSGNTCKTYINSLRLFVDYLLTMKGLGSLQ